MFTISKKNYSSILYFLHSQGSKLAARLFLERRLLERRTDERTERWMKEQTFSN